MGRRAMRVALQELHGNPGGRVLVEPEGVGVLWKPPAWFDDEQREAWHYAIEHAPPGLLSATDQTVLAAWCVHSVEFQKAALAVREYGQTSVAPKSKAAMQNAHVGIMNRQTEMLVLLSNKLGFSPASRAQIGRALGREATLPTSPGPQQIAGSKLGAYLDEKPDKLDS